MSLTETQQGKDSRSGVQPFLATIAHLQSLQQKAFWKLLPKSEKLLYLQLLLRELSSWIQKMPLAQSFLALVQKRTQKSEHHAPTSCAAANPREQRQNPSVVAEILPRLNSRAKMVRNSPSAAIWKTLESLLCLSAQLQLP